jgi:D-alanine transaminase
MHNPPLSLPIVYLNGEFIPVEDAKISPLDRGFIFGDGIYEVIPVYGGKPLRMAEHLQRLQMSLDEVQMANPYSTEEWIAIIRALVAKNEVANVAVYLQVTRGVAKRDFAMPVNAAPTVFMMANILPTPSAAQYAKGIACISIDDFRWEKCHIKSTSLLGAVLLKQQTIEACVDECVLFRDDFLTESSASNVVVVRLGALLCPPMKNLILAGITYRLMIELAEKAGIHIELRPVSRDEVHGADELWMTSSTKDVIAITQLDGKPVGSAEFSGKPGPLFWKMHALFAEYKA